MPKLTLVGRDAEKKNSMISLELVLLLVLATLAGAGLWVAGSGVMERTERGETGYERGLDELKGSF